MFGNLINNALSSVGSLSGLAKSMITKDVQIYDASTNEITIAGLEITGWESAKLSEAEVTKDYLGLYRNEVALVKQVYVRKLSISFLPTANSSRKMEELATVCLNLNKYFVINITENGQWIGDYQAQFSSVSGVHLAQEAENTTFEFYVIPVFKRPVSYVPNQ